ncbi:hypothetical protein HJA82_29430 [Rhizobium bangladeshense]|uniref:hypothetical protein n=1 Tax=Rhizobium bangladeshense TaxID=1138189 RepID=UPI001C830DC5|nr:hypothetical protein [Rhizobium bangladeshense]MBX4911438.1 hypothetical protein [Rhizobium bangladeshense]
MQVSQILEIDTHAVIGGGVAQSFGMADSPEFFRVLSSTLYRDKKRAMIREVICNGWDAHIKAGCTDRHLEITLTDDEIVFKDFGPGIPADLIVPIYCVYGASTKVKDEKATGGFGLGSKSPFAYTDHFTVDSRHAGLRNVYALSLGGASTEGRPEIRPMVEDIPTDEHGLTVTIPLRNKDDRHELFQHIRTVAYQGGMLVKVNGQELKRVDYEPARKQGFCTIVDLYSNMHESTVYLLYGTVLYPVTTTDLTIYQAAKRASDLIGEGYKLVLIAPPNSVGVTPSRESLSYTELTTATILRLLKRASNVIESAMPSAGKEVIGRLVEKHGLTSPNEKNIKSVYYPPNSGGLIMTDPKEIAAYSIGRNPDRLPLKQRHKFLCAGLIRKYPEMRAALRRASRLNQSFDEIQQQFDFRRVVKMASRLKLLDDTFAYDNNEEFGGTKRMMSIRAGLNNEGDVIPTIYLAPNRRELTSMIVSSKIDPLDRDKTFYVGMVVGSKPSKDLLQRIEKTAEAFKFEIEAYDFEWEKPKVVRVKKPADLFHNLDDYDHDYKLVEPSLDKPKFFLWASINSGTMKVGLEQHTRMLLKTLYPGTAIVTTKEQFEKLGKAGAVHVLNDVAARLRKLLKSREVQYGFLLSHRKFAPEQTYHGYDWKLGKTANTLANMNIEIAKLIFPDRVKLGSKWNEARKLVNILRNFSYANQPGLELVNDQLPAHAVDELEAAARTTFKDMIVPTPERMHDRSSLDYLEMLVDSDWIGVSKPRADQVERLVGVIRYLQRFGSKSKLTSRNNAANTIKEAA